MVCVQLTEDHGVAAGSRCALLSSASLASTFVLLLQARLWFSSCPSPRPPAYFQTTAVHNWCQFFGVHGKGKRHPPASKKSNQLVPFLFCWGPLASVVWYLLVPAMWKKWSQEHGRQIQTILRCLELTQNSHLKRTLSLDCMHCTDGTTWRVTCGYSNLTQRAFNVHHWGKRNRHLQWCTKKGLVSLVRDSGQWPSLIIKSMC